MKTIKVVLAVLLPCLSSCTTAGLSASGLAGVGGKAVSWFLNNFKENASAPGQIQGEWTALSPPCKFNFQNATNGYFSTAESDKCQTFVWSRTGQTVNVNAVGGRTFVFSLVNGKLKGVIDDKEVVLVKSDS